MTEESSVDYQALYEQLCEENEELRVNITKLKVAKINMDWVVNAARVALRNGYFWCGYFVAIIVMLFIGVFRKGYIA